MRIRSIIPKFYESEDVGNMDWAPRLVFIGLWSYVDDNGVGRDIGALIAADLFPFDLSRDSRDTLARVADSLQTLSAGGQITRYTVAGREYLFVNKWDEYQRIDRPAKARYPRPTTDDAEIRETVATPSRDPRDTPATGEGEKGRRGEVVDAPAKRASTMPKDWIPSASAIEYATTNGLDLDHEAEQFTNHHLAKGSKFKDWDRAFRTWLGNAAKWQAERTPERRPSDDSWDHLKGDPDAAWNQFVADCAAKGIDPYEAIA